MYKKTGKLLLAILGGVTVILKAVVEYLTEEGK